MTWLGRLSLLVWGARQLPLHRSVPAGIGGSLARSRRANVLAAADDRRDRGRLAAIGGATLVDGRPTPPISRHRRIARAGLAGDRGRRRANAGALMPNPGGRAARRR